MYKTIRVWKNSNRKQIISRNLTEKEAQKEVKKDIEVNPRAEKTMLIYTKE